MIVRTKKPVQAGTTSDRGTPDAHPDVPASSRPDPASSSQEIRDGRHLAIARFVATIAAFDATAIQGPAGHPARMAIAAHAEPAGAARAHRLPSTAARSWATTTAKTPRTSSGPWSPARDAAQSTLRPRRARPATTPVRAALAIVTTSAWPRRGRMSRRIAAGNLVGQVALAQGAPAASRSRWRMHDPLAGSSWSTPSTVAGFVRSRPMRPCCALPRPSGIARPRASRSTSAAAPVVTPCRSRARAGACWAPISWPMLSAARDRARGAGRLCALAPMDALPVRAGACDLVVAHGIWNLSRSMAELRRAVDEARRVAAPGAALFVFTFSRNTLPPTPPPCRRAVHLHAVFGPAAMFLDA